MATLVIAVVVVVDRIADGATLGAAIASNGRWDAMFQANVAYFQLLFHDFYGGLVPPSLGGLAVYWSLSVEEQFYLVFPALFILIATNHVRWSVRSRLGVLLTVLIISSLAYTFSINPYAAYVSPLARGWELAVGGLLAVATVWLKRLPNLFAAAITWVGLSGILIVVLASDQIPNWPRITFPLWPVVATALVIAGGTAAPRFGAEALLRLAPFKWLALWSFSLYLWHKPIDVWAVQLEGGNLSLWGDILVIGIAIGVSAVCYTWIENPIRHSKRLARSGSASVIWGLSLILSCVMLTLAVQFL